MTHKHTHTHFPWLISFLYTPTYTHSLSRALVLTGSERGRFLKVPARPGAVDAVGHVKSELEPDAELGSGRIDSHLWDYPRASVCVRDQENHFLDSIQVLTSFGSI